VNEDVSAATVKKRTGEKAGQDSALAAEVRAELHDVADLVGRFMEINVSAGVVVLSGVCGSGLAKRTAVDVISRIPGVLEIHDELSVE
jgi:osmotically-inducible protein OsmY